MLVLRRTILSSLIHHWLETRIWYLSNKEFEPAANDHMVYRNLLKLLIWPLSHLKGVFMWTVDLLCPNTDWLVYTHFSCEPIPYLKVMQKGLYVIKWIKNNFPHLLTTMSVIMMLQRSDTRIVLIGTLH